MKNIFAAIVILASLVSTHNAEAFTRNEISILPITPGGGGASLRGIYTGHVFLAIYADYYVVTSDAAGIHANIHIDSNLDPAQGLIDAVNQAEALKIQICAATGHYSALPRPGYIRRVMVDYSVAAGPAGRYTYSCPH